MAECRCRHSTFHQGEYLHTLHGFAFKFNRVGHRLGYCVPCHVKVAESELAHTCVTGSELRRFHYLVDQFLGKFLAGLVMPGKRIEKFLLREIVFVELRRKFYKITIHCRSRQRGVIAFGQQSVERMSELVKESLHLIGGKKRGSLGCRFGEVHHNRNLRTFVNSLGIDALVTETCHPRSRTLGGTREEVRINDPYEIPLVIGHIKRLDIRVIHLYVIIAGELNSIELGGQPEHAVDHIVKLEIRAQLLFVIAVTLVLQFVGIVAVIPRLDFHWFPFKLRGEIGQLCQFTL